MNDRWITLNQASDQINKSVSTIKRLIKKYNIPTRKASNKQYNPAILVDRSALINLLANDQSLAKVMDQPLVDQRSDQVVDLLQAQIRELKAREVKLEQRIDLLERENKVLNEELKALLRQRNQSRGVIGYLVDQVWRGQK